MTYIKSSIFYTEIPYKTFYCISACNTYHTACTTVSLMMNPKRFETCRRQIKH